MEFLTPSLNEVVSKLSENQKEEISIIELIININENQQRNHKRQTNSFY